MLENIDVIINDFKIEIHELEQENADLKKQLEEKQKVIDRLVKASEEK